MELLDAIYTRRAIREYTKEPVTEAQLQALIDAAVQAPSAMNQQPWSFCVVRDQALLKRISDEAKVFMLRSSPAGLVSHHFEEILGNEAFHIFYHAPALILICANAESPWARTDCALAAQNLMLAARASGLGTCWIGFAQGWLDTPEGRKATGLPTDCIPVAPIIVGHPVKEAPATPRNPPIVRGLGNGAL
jgi:nitroreductase